jgi:hypothetical protein
LRHCFARSDKGCGKQVGGSKILFAPLEILAKILAFFAQYTALIESFVFDKNANYFAEKWQNRGKL